ncbi:molybdenum cofactor guanylyltransferase [Corynebacterium sp. UMB2355A]|uniref:molybdenum cofactor guanylyltransferase n=1 Tax=Corynebacterium sp. UMB2355A TaxID=3081222 RepID=UPI0029FF0F27|nr:NTP transferase domain-containing protein [Corynebacterium sp. UMB2355A]WPJ92768.1 NTP transferase domain-containing protein [Corynebacterium sp. UMB2355A]
MRSVQHKWEDVGVIVLAGGRSTRMGADKAQVKVNGTRLVDAVCARIPDDVPRIVVSPKPLGMPTVSEDPPFGGPVAGIAAGLSRIDAPFVAIVSVDAPRSPELIPVLSQPLATVRTLRSLKLRMGICNRYVRCGTGPP